METEETLKTVGILETLEVVKILEIPEVMKLRRTTKVTDATMGRMTKRKDANLLITMYEYNCDDVGLGLM